ncbi:MAG: hypothetical protein AB1630_09280 [bacterium]
MANRAFSYDIALKMAEVFGKHKVEYLFIGKSGAVLYGFPDTTQDVDVFPKKDPQNGERIVFAMEELGFDMDEELKSAIIKGKDFVQIREGPFDIDLIFAPDGIETYEEAKKRSKIVENIFPVASLGDIIKSKRSAGRKRDKEVLERLEAFDAYLKHNV